MQERNDGADADGEQQKEKKNQNNHVEDLRRDPLTSRRPLWPDRELLIWTRSNRLPMRLLEVGE